LNVRPQAASLERVTKRLTSHPRGRSALIRYVTYNVHVYVTCCSSQWLIDMYVYVCVRVCVRVRVIVDACVCVRFVRVFNKR
jgi:hypothetical protein